MYQLKTFVFIWLTVFLSPALCLWGGLGTKIKDGDIIETRGKTVPEAYSIDLTLESPKPLYYEQGIQKLMSFRGKPACQQIAAKILVVECQNLDKVDSDTGEAEFVDDALYAHAVSIAICHLDVARAEVPASCQRYGRSALSSSYKEGNYKALHGTSDEIHACVEDLFKDGRSWTTLSHLLQDGRSICRAARYDIERDRVIDTNIKVTNAMQEIFDKFTTDMYETSEIRKVQDDEMNEMVRSWLTQLQMVKNEDASILEGAKENLENLENGVKSASEVVVNIRNAFAELIESGKRAVNEHETAVSINKDIANGAQSGLEVISVVNRDLAILLQVSQQQNEAAVELNRRLITLNDRFVVMDEQVNNVTSSMATMSTDLQNLNSQHEQIVTLFGTWSSAMLLICKPSTWLIVFALLCAIALLALRRWVLLCSLSTICMIHLAWASLLPSNDSAAFQNAGGFFLTILNTIVMLCFSNFAKKISTLIGIAFVVVTITMTIPRLKMLLAQRRDIKRSQEIKKRVSAIRSNREANDCFYG